MAALNRASLRYVRSEPHLAAAWLTAHAVLWATTVTVVAHSANLTIFAVTFQPPRQLTGYPVEKVRIVVRRDGEVIAVPVGPDRTWKHRYAKTPLEAVPATRRIDWQNLLGGLCLWYPDDPEHLRWTWADGLDGFLRIVQRHVWFEEYHRLGNPWPTEDAPHGEAPDGGPHPILTHDLRRPA